MSILAKAMRLAAAALNAAADAHERDAARPAQARAAASFDRHVAHVAEQRRRTNLLIELSQRTMHARHRQTENALRSIAPCPHCASANCTCR